jgi:NDP-sugar pyrophosphorylase family protein
MRAVVLAGGAGIRLKPYTTTIPKPLAPIGGEQAILEIVLRQLARAGFRRVTLAVNHMAHLVMAYFGDGARWQLELDYSIESQPLGTVGPLALIPDLPDDFLVLNGDVLTDLDHRAFLEAHLADGNDVTVAVCRRTTQVAFGVVQYGPDRRVREFVEKPAWEHDVSMGIYGVKRRVLARLPPGAACGFDRLIQDGLARGERIGVVPFGGFWLDIGTPEDYDRANERWPELRPRLLG